MKVKEKDLVIGDEYYISEKKTERGIFVGVFRCDNGDDGVFFYPTTDESRFFPEDDGTIGIWVDPNTEGEYEEV